MARGPSPGERARDSVACCVDTQTTAGCAVGVRGLPTGFKQNPLPRLQGRPRDDSVRRLVTVWESQASRRSEASSERYPHSPQRYKREKANRETLTLRTGSGPAVAPALAAAEAELPPGMRLLQHLRLRFSVPGKSAPNLALQLTSRALVGTRIPGLGP